MRRIVKAVLFSSTLLLGFAAPTLAEEAKQPAPAAAAPEAQSSSEAGGCPAEGKCCGSAACAEAKKQLKDGKAAMADCPCRRNKNKPQHNN
jgi:hypothetical protein